MYVWEKQQTINHEMELTREGGSAAFHADAKKVLKLSLHLPLENKSLGMYDVPRLSTASSCLRGTQY